MPTEMRQITFRGPEVITAIVEYYRRRSMTLPAGSITNVEIVNNAAISAVVHVQNDANVKNEVEIGSEMLAAALILYCINRKIPLPAEAEKRLQKVGDEVALFVVKRQR